MSRSEIQKAGLKVTTPRINILNILEKNAGHLTAEDIFTQLKAQDMDVSLATVYRVLSQFEDAKLIIRHNFGDNTAIYELNDGKQHDHIVCTSCGKVEEFVNEVILQEQNNIANDKNFKITSHSLYIFGLCELCQMDLT